MQTNLYVDNIVTSYTEQEAVQYYKEATPIISKANFDFHSWSSNRAMLKAITTQDKTSDEAFWSISDCINLEYQQKRLFYTFDFILRIETLPDFFGSQT